MIDPLPIWKTKLKELQALADSSWAENFAKWAADRVGRGTSTDGKGIEASSSLLGGVPIQFTFNKAVFAAELKKLGPVEAASVGLMGFANAWEKAIMASAVQTMPGAFSISPAPPTLFSAVMLTVIDQPSILKGKNVILTLESAPQVEDPEQSQFPIKFRAAFAGLTITVNGLNSDPDGPTPLTAPTVLLV